MNTRTSAILTLSLLSLASLATAQITPGNLVVLRVGTGAAALSNASTATFLDEFTTAGTLVQSIPMPTAASGLDLPCTVSGSATSEGLLTLSADGRYLVAVGYSAAPGITSIVATTSVATPRVVARIALDGTVDSSTAIDNLFSANNIRSAVTTDGSQFWVSGANSGVVYTTLGATGGTSLNATAPTNLRAIGVAGGQLFTTTSSGSAGRFLAVGTGLPTTAGQTLTSVAGFPLSGGSPYDFHFADANTLYLADDGTFANGGGIQKWTLSAGTWSRQYVLSAGASVGCRGLSGYTNGGTTTLYATTTTNLLVAVTDTGASATFTTLATGVTNTALRGVRFVNVPHSVSFAGTGSPNTVGVPTIAPQNGLPVIGNAAFAIGSSNFVASGFGFGLLDIGTLGAGQQIPGAQVGALVFLNPLSLVAQIVLADGAGATSLPFGIPNAGALAGLPVASQFLSYDPMLADPTPFGTSGGMQIVVGF